MNTLFLIRDLRQLLKARGVWCKGAFAFDEHRNAVDPTRKSACHFSLDGGIRYLLGARLGTPIPELGMKALRVMSQIAGTKSLWAWQDEPKRKHEDVMTLLGATIGVLEKGALAA